MSSTIGEIHTVMKSFNTVQKPFQTCQSILMKIHLLRSHRKKKLIQLLSPNRTKNPTFLHQLSPPLVYIPGSWSSSLVYASTSPSQSKLANQMGDTFRRVGKPMRLRDVLVTGGQNIWRITPPSAWPR